MVMFKNSTIAFYTLLRREVMRIFRIWTQTLLPSVITTALYLIIFGHLIGNRVGEMKGYTYLEFILPGLIMMSIITNSYGNVVSSFYLSKFQRNLEEMLVSPMPNAMIILGFVLGGVVRGVIIGLLVGVVSLFFTSIYPAHLLLSLFIGVLIAALFSLAGLINGIFAKSFDDITIVPTFILTPLTYLGGVFFSVDLLPQSWKWLVYFNPVFYKINVFRYAMLGISDVELNLALIIMITLLITLYCFTLWLFKRGVGIRT
jgi:ABC-2 type transport system permease protein